MPKKRRLVAVDLFCGAGGMSLGFEQAGLDVVAAVDSNLVHAATHSKNFPNCKTIVADLSKLTGRELRAFARLQETRIDVVFGGPPCQGFSFMGKRELHDPRNRLLFDFARIVRDLGPSYFVCENVEGLLFGEAKGLLESFIKRMKSSGYRVVEPVQTLDAYDFGVPQHRRRAFVIGHRQGLAAPRYPQPGKKPPPTVWEAIGDLGAAGDGCQDEYHGQLPAAPSTYAAVLRGEAADPTDLSHARDRNGQGLTGCSRTEHSPKTIERFGATQQGGFEPVSRFYRLNSIGTANTIRAGTGVSHGSFTAPRPIHPTQARCITVREAARLSSYPDWFQFNRTIWHGFRQVGNSVPPFMARAVAESILRASTSTNGEDADGK